MNPVRSLSSPKVDLKKKKNGSVLITYSITRESQFPSNNESGRGKIVVHYRKKVYLRVIACIISPHHGPITPGPDQLGFHISFLGPVLA